MFDAFANLIDDRTIDQKIYDALKRRIHLHGMTLEVRPSIASLVYPPQHVREVRLFDAYAGAGMYYVEIDSFENDPDGYMDYVAEKLIDIFARERYLIKRK